MNIAGSIIVVEGDAVLAGHKIVSMCVCFGGTCKAHVLIYVDVEYSCLSNISIIARRKHGYLLLGGRLITSVL